MGQIDEYTKAENTGRNAYKKVDYLFKGNTDYTFTENQFEKYDVYYPKIDRTDEIKYRNIYSGKYIYKGYILEKNKYDELIQHRQSYYINFFSMDSTIIVWDIKNLVDPKFEWKWCTETTATDYGKKVLKEVTELRYEDAVLITEYNGTTSTPIPFFDRDKHKRILYSLYKNNKEENETNIE